MYSKTANETAKTLVFISFPKVCEQRIVYPSNSPATESTPATTSPFALSSLRCQTSQLLSATKRQMRKFKHLLCEPLRARFVRSSQVVR